MNSTQDYIKHLETKEWWTKQEARHWALENPGCSVWYVWSDGVHEPGMFTGGTFHDCLKVDGVQRQDRFKNPNWKDPNAPLSFDEAIERLKRDEPVWCRKNPINGNFVCFNGSSISEWATLKVLSDAGIKLYANKPEEAQGDD